MAFLSPIDPTKRDPLQDAPAPITRPTPPEEAVPLHLRAADILENVSDAFVALDRDWRILYANREACRINQKPLGEFVGRIHWEEWPAAVGTALELQLRRAMDEREEAHLEHRYVAGSYDVWIEADVYPSDDGINLFYRDTTGRKQAQEELRRSEERYRSLVEATAEIVWTNTPQGEMRGPQPGWGGFTGQAEAEYQGYGWARAVHPEDAQPTVDAWNQAVAARTTFLFEHRVRRQDGVYRTFAVRAVAILHDDSTIREWVGIHTDVTERRAMEAAREAVLAQQGVFLRDVLSSVTEGKLLLSTNPAHLPAPLVPVGEAIALTREGGLRDLRLRAQAAAQGAGHSEERQFDLITAVSEAGMNAILHGGGGTGQVSVGESGTVQVRVEDQGGGIAMENLPRATLSRGFSTKATLGHGLKMMLETADRLYLLTGSSGTTVVLEQERDRPLPAWL
jgi:PAS domain S-box-containing protein